MNTVKEYLGKVSVTANGVWDVRKEYNRLSLVYVGDEEQGTVKSYISKKPVPAGVYITDREYWQPFGFDLEGTMSQSDKQKLDGIEPNATQGVTVRDTYNNALQHSVCLDFMDSFYIEGDNDGFALINLKPATNSILGGVRTGYDADDDYTLLPLETDNAGYGFISLPDVGLSCSTHQTPGEIPIFLYRNISFPDFRATLYSDTEEAVFTLPIASPSLPGLIKLGYTDDVETRKFGVKKDANNRAYVEVPYSDMMLGCIDNEGRESFIDYINFDGSKIIATVEEDENTCMLTLDIPDTPIASHVTNGLMSTTMYDKLDGISPNANNYTLPLASELALGGIKTKSAAITDQSEMANYTDQFRTYNDCLVLKKATTTTDGAMSYQDKVKLNSITAGATKGFDVRMGSIPHTGVLNLRINALDNGLYCEFDDETTLHIGMYKATSIQPGTIRTGYTQNGKNYPVVIDGDGDAYVNVPWTDTNTTYEEATTTDAGLMSAADKIKLNTLTDPFVTIGISDIQDVQDVEKDAIYYHLKTYGNFDKLLIRFPGTSSESSLYHYGKVKSWSFDALKTASYTDPTAQAWLRLEIVYKTSTIVETVNVDITKLFSEVYSDFNLDNLIYYGG